eukprot:TRINITY_DN59634_c0_g1_i1.p1 TRINITY_DN59634_c0_g1~~TRINITY_DN59634_c0_g1_i1.p1  ORF type:complete len:553 (-),score=13.17 TRINITY_DN59634_c0_g1_i1:133-1791(-)
MSSNDPPGTPAGTVVNIMKNAVGGGILALPFAFAGLGLSGGILALAGCSTLALFACYFLVVAVEVTQQTTGSNNTFSYRKIMEAAFGSKAGVLVDVMLAGYTIGTTVAYGVLLQQFINNVLVQSLGPDHFLAKDENTFIILAFCFIVEVVLVALKDLEALKWTSFAGVALLVYAVAAVVFEFFHTFDSKINTTLHWDIHFSQHSLQCIPIVCFTYGMHYNIPRFYRELPNRSPWKMSMICLVAILLCNALYITMAFFGYFTFGAAARSNIIGNYKPTNKLMTVARLGLFGELLCTFPIIHNGTRLALAALIWDSNSNGARSGAARTTSSHPCTPLEPNGSPTEKKHSGYSPLLMDEEKQWTILTGKEGPTGSTDPILDGGPKCFGGQCQLVPTRVWLMSICVILFVFIVAYICKHNLGVVIDLNSSVFGSTIYFTFPGLFYCKLCPNGPAWKFGIAVSLILTGLGVLCTGVIGAVCGHHAEAPVMTCVSRNVRFVWPAVLVLSIVVCGMRVMSSRSRAKTAPTLVANPIRHRERDQHRERGTTPPPVIQMHL